MIYFATDHRGFELKEKLKKFVADELEFEVKDFGAFAYDPDDDYPDFVRKAAKAVSQNPEKDRAIILGGSGQGEAITANRFPNARAIVYYGGPEEIITLSREHNDANILSVGASFVNDPEIFGAVRLWLSTDFSNDARHIRRIEKIDTKN